MEAKVIISANPFNYITITCTEANISRLPMEWRLTQEVFSPKLISLAPSLHNLTQFGKLSGICEFINYDNGNSNDDGGLSSEMWPLESQVKLSWYERKK